MKLPSTLRPTASEYRECKEGIDFPSWFFDELKSIDSKLFIVWHPYQMIWDNIMNQYVGALDDPRFTIHREHGEEVWGFVTTDGQGSPLPEQAWHVWRLCEPHGWAHVVRIDSKAPAYLKLLTKRLHIQARFRDKYGDMAWNRQLRADQEQAKEQALKDKQAMFEAVQDENSWLLKNAMENFQRGKIKPTNPEKETITSYKGQGHRSRLVRPLDDSDVGLIGFDR